MTRLSVDARWMGPHGIGRFAREVLGRLDGVPLSVPLAPTHPLDPLATHLALRRTRPALHFTPGFNPPLASPVPLVFTVHDLIHLDVPEEAGWTRRLYYDRVVRPALHHAARVLTVSEASRQRLLEWGGVPETQVVVVGNGVGPNFTPDGDVHQPGYPYLLYVGNRKPHKNVPRLLRAFAALGLPELRLVLSGPPDAETAHLALSLGVYDRVVFSGLIPEEELPAYYRGASALAFPSLYEGFGLPAAEAMACGVPVVTSTTTSLPEIVGDAAILVDPRDMDAIRDGLHRAVTDQSLRANLRSRSLRRAATFNWDRAAERVQAVLQDALEQA
ncbi:glycosyltransferase family 4 protein [Deinococcus apachensis]|uniref:glycosyltransferase family 4 protein n=1 Tax=Deinococcus apachensis TaxID=309886 RepID=UPI00037C532C|nr:glycosyltransferase family 1 protein [Deinococcus apachensis]